MQDFNFTSTEENVMAMKKALANTVVVPRRIKTTRAEGPPKVIPFPEATVRKARKVVKPPMKKRKLLMKKKKGVMKKK